jgi:hypothetical protein
VLVPTKKGSKEGGDEAARAACSSVYAPHALAECRTSRTVGKTYQPVLVEWDDSPFGPETRPLAADDLVCTTVNSEHLKEDPAQPAFSGRCWRWLPGER